MNTAILDRALKALEQIGKPQVASDPYLPAEIDLEELRAHRDEVVRVLQQRQEVPAMPPGVRLISWELKEPPVAIEMCTTVVINPARFAKSTLLQLQAALKGKRWLAGHWSAAELVERLKQVGVEVELDS